MTMTAGVRKFALTMHLICSIGWIGAAAAYLGLGIVGTTTADPDTVRAVWIAMELVGWLVIAPLAVGALVTGLIMAIGTPWGLVRHYWVLISLALTVLSTVTLLLHMPVVTATAEVARGADPARLGRLGGDLFHAGLGLVVLLVITVLNVYKPRGMTKYGWRMQRAQRAVAANEGSRAGDR